MGDETNPAVVEPGCGYGPDPRRRQPVRHIEVGQGAAGSPIIAGFLFKALGNDQLLTVSLIMCSGAILGAVMVWLLPLRDADADLGDIPAGEPLTT